ncbi:hypothetical protein PoB_004883500 [Plakobranchus ocellatus]|uniref:Uncharacterized protein n=1 Tax=Plakobranchus ocellatus TaxID=259542 RepID=A0AAV4BP46_9GAST|nr:hypothetical protein PoB_004883500 [Plakobranchus ocellatus]
MDFRERFQIFGLDDHLCPFPQTKNLHRAYPSSGRPADPDEVILPWARVVFAYTESIRRPPDGLLSNFWRPLADSRVLLAAATETLECFWRLLFCL